MEGGKPENSEKNRRNKEKTDNKLYPLMSPGLGIKPRPHWWETSAVTTAPPLLPKSNNDTQTSVGFYQLHGSFPFPVHLQPEQWLWYVLHMPEIKQATISFKLRSVTRFAVQVNENKKVQLLWRKKVFPYIKSYSVRLVPKRTVASESHCQVFPSFSIITVWYGWFLPT